MSSMQVDPRILIAAMPAHYERSRMWKNKGSDSAANRRTLVTPDYMTININNVGYLLLAAQELDLNVDANWDKTGISATWQASHSYALNAVVRPTAPNNYVYVCTTAGASGLVEPTWGTTPGGTTADNIAVWTCYKDSTIAANRAGIDYFIYACQPVSGSSPIILLSSDSTYPLGYTANSSRKVGQFHCECANVGTISLHPLTGYLAGDILPRSIQDLKFRPRSGFRNGIVFAGVMDFLSDVYANVWAFIYLASGTGASTASVYGGTISDTRDWLSFVDDFQAIGCRMPTDSEFQGLAFGSNEQTNIFGSGDPVTTGGHVDTASRRMISYIGCEDCCGATYQWLDENGFRVDFDGYSGAASKTVTVYHVASPGGNPIYLKYLTDGTPYLCCNMANDAVDKWVTVGSTFRLLITHDASASAGLQVYFDEDATQPARLLAVLARGVNANVCVSPYAGAVYCLQITYNANAASLGVAVTYDDATDERLEFTSPTAANGTLDLALATIAWGWYVLPGSKGQLYRQGAYGDVKLRAGGYWGFGALCGSRCRAADYYRWYTYSSLGGRGCAEPA